jgi:hypothetical protein
MKKIILALVVVILFLLGIVYLVQNGRLVIPGYTTPPAQIRPVSLSDCGTVGKDLDGKEKIFNCVTSMFDDFENGLQISESKWHKQINQTSRGNEGDKENYLEITTEQAHSGTYSLKTFTATDPGDLQKSALARELLFFPAGSDFWYSAWYYIPGDNTQNLFLFELESTRYHYVGRRLSLTGENGNILYIQAKKDTGEDFYQSGTPTLFPKNTWVHIILHFYLSPDNDGLAELWQDDKKIIEGRGPNIPAGQFYDWISVGQTANNSHYAQTIYVDDVSVSDSPFINK